jgi:rare lipoprotein A (peptidoglycan hydrolase)
MLLKERWFNDPPVAFAAASPAYRPMAHNERWVSDRLTAAAATATSPAYRPMAHNERWVSNRLDALAAITPSTSIAARTPLPPHRVSDKLITGTALAPTLVRVRSPMLVKERWFKHRPFVTARAGPPPSPRYSGGAILPKGGGRHQIGKPYKVSGRWFIPKDEPGYDAMGIASWYGEAFHRRMTSNGEWFDMDFLSAAHPTLPLPSYVKVTNLDNGSAIIVRVNDRGPFADDRIIDVSKKCAEALGFRDRGTANVRVQYLGAAPLDDGGSHLRAVNRELRRGTEFARMLSAADAAVRTLAAAEGTSGRSF